MKEDPLKIVDVDSNHQQEPMQRSYTARESYKEELQAQLERQWLKNPAQFDPNRNVMEKERLTRTWELITAHLTISNIQAVDLGCANGVFSRKLKEAGAKVDALDIASNALKAFEKQGSDGITLKKGYVPHTLLEDDHYDLVCGMDLIAHLHRNEHRLFFAELARLVKPKGWVVSSTPLDIHTDGALNIFASLASTEFDLVEWTLSYHGWFIRLRAFFSRPEYYLKGADDPENRLAEMKKRKGLRQKWYQLNTSPLMRPFWKGLDWLLTPITMLFRTNRSLLLGLEKMAKFFSPDKNLSHATFIGQRKALIPPEPPEEIPVDRRGKKQIWD